MILSPDEGHIIYGQDGGQIIPGQAGAHTIPDQDGGHVEVEQVEAIEYLERHCREFVEAAGIAFRRSMTSGLSVAPIALRHVPKQVPQLVTHLSTRKTDMRSVRHGLGYEPASQ